MVIALWILASWIIGIMGTNKKFGFWGFFFGSLLFSPIVGLLMFFAADQEDVYDHSRI